MGGRKASCFPATRKFKTFLKCNLFSILCLNSTVPFLTSIEAYFSETCSYVCFTRSDWLSVLTIGKFYSFPVTPYTAINDKFIKCVAVKFLSTKAR